MFPIPANYVNENVFHIFSVHRTATMKMLREIPVWFCLQLRTASLIIGWLMLIITLPAVYFTYVILFTETGTIDYVLL